MEVPRYWRNRQQRYSLKGETCPGCDEKIFPARAVCPHCGYPLSLLEQDMQSIAVLMPERAQQPVSVSGDR
jgi:uncharacterized OB-fold protein